MNWRRVGQGIWRLDHDFDDINIWFCLDDDLGVCYHIKLTLGKNNLSESCILSKYEPFDDNNDTQYYQRQAEAFVQEKLRWLPDEMNMMAKDLRRISRDLERA